MKARQRKQWIAGLAMAMTVATISEVKAQQSTAGAAATGAGSSFADIRAPQSFGTNPGAISPFSPSFRRPLSGTFGVQPFGLFGGGAAGFGFTPTTPFAADIRAPQSFSANPGLATPFFPDIRQPLTGTFNAAGTLPFVNGSGVNGLAADPSFVNGGVSGFGGGTPFFFGPSGIYWTPDGTAVTPVPVAVPIPVPVQPGEMAQPQRRRLRLTPTPERRSIQAAEQVMARTALTEGTVVSADSRNVKVRVESKVRSYPRAQVFFFTNGEEMRSAAVQTKGIARGARVLVPAL